MANSTVRRRARPSGQRLAGASGLVFVVLLLVGAGMVSVPGADSATATVRRFYEQHAGVIVLAQAVELLSVAPLVMFFQGLATSSLVGGARHLRAAGWAMAAAAVVTAVPPLWLCVAASGGSADLIDALALLSDLVDVLLFLTIAWFAASCARELLGPRWLQWSALAVAVVCALRAVEILLRSSILELPAPVAFLLFVGAISVLLVRERHVRPHGLRPS